jgi:diguanylate cyclase (GGDEF)-like protein
MAANTVNAIYSTIAGKARKLAFLRHNFYLLLGWPIGALLLGALAWSVLLSHLDGLGRDAEQAALRHTASLARTYAGNLSRTIESIDQILLHVKYELALADGRLRLENIDERGLFPSQLLVNIAISDRNGMLLTSTTPFERDTSVASRPFFQWQKQASGDALHIGLVTFGQVSERPVIPFTRRLTDAAGEFNGIVLASVVPDFFTASYDDATLGRHGFLGSVERGAVTGVTRIGDKVYPPGAEGLLAAPSLGGASGSVLLLGARWFADGRSRYVGWDVVQAYPLYALAGLDQEEALAEYRESRAAAIRNAVLATLVLAAFTLTAMGLSLRLAWRKHRMEETQAAYRMATEEGSEGFYIARPVRDGQEDVVDFEIIDSNHRGAEFLRERREELIGKRISLLYAGANPERLMSWLREAVAKGFYENEVEVPGDSPFRLAWAHVKAVRTNGDLAITLRDISERRAQVAELERRSNQDELTALPNRHWAQAYLPRAVGQAEKHGVQLGILFVDLDGFKKVNDTMGHAVGDEVLRTAALRIKEAVRPHDNVVRIGGDEFVVIIEQIEHRQDAAHVAQRVVQAFRQSIRTSKGVHAVGASIGIATFPADGANAETLLQNADIAMYSVKTAGKGGYRFYDRKFYDALRERLARESDLRAAIENDQFLLFYQPRVDLASGAFSSMEALVRWQHPDRGVVEPLEFISLAEESGLILELDKLVIEKACSQLAQWAQQEGTLIPVSVNVSSRQFNEAGLPEVLAGALARHGIDPGLLELEITESLMTGGTPEVNRTLTAIRRMGVKLLVDDFGSGYSSLAQLQRLDFDVLKVDRAFTADLDGSDQGQGQAFFTAIVTMAHALGMRVVAEGVENARQAEILKALGCDEIQGYYVSRPLPPAGVQLG